MMTSFLAGTMFDDLKRDPVTRAFIPSTTGHFFTAYDVAQFTDLDEFCKNVREARDRIRSSPPKAGVDRVYAPGDLENARARGYDGEGIPLEQFTLDDLAWVAEHVGIEYNLA